MPKRSNAKVYVDLSLRISPEGRLTLDWLTTHLGFTSPVDVIELGVRSAWAKEISTAGNSSTGSSPSLDIRSLLIARNWSKITPVGYKLSEQARLIMDYFKQRYTLPHREVVVEWALEQMRNEWQNVVFPQISKSNVLE